jgi:hypothetical protein
MKSESFLVSAMIGASGSMPLVLAQTTSTAPGGVVIPVWAISVITSVFLGTLGFLLKRSWEQVDRTLEKLDARVGRVEDRITGMEQTLHTKKES